MKIVRGVIIVALVVLFSYALRTAAVHSDFMKLQKIEITGASADTEARVRKNLKIQIGDFFWSSPVEREAENIKRDSWVESVEVRRQFPNVLSITILERKPYAVIADTKGKFKFIDDNNNVIDSAKPNQISQLPMMSGEKFENDGDLRSRALEILKSLPEDGYISRSDTGEISFDNDHGFQMTLANSGILLDLGKDNIPLHIDRARRVVQYLAQHNINASRVDSDYAKKVLVKVRKGR